MLGLQYHLATLLALILIVTFSAHIFTNAILKNMKKMKFYISGKIGEEVISEATREKFARAERMLKAKGYEVFNPTCEEWQRHVWVMYEKDRHSKEPWLDGMFPDLYGYTLLRDLMVLSAKDAIYMLNDWRKSPGATAEYYFAKATGKRMLFADRHDACEHLIERMYREVRAGNPPGEYLELPQNDAEIAYFSKHLHEAWLPIEGGER